MVHLVTCLLRGARLNPQGLEPQLQQALMQLEPLELLASEREASRSRTASRLKGGLGGIVFWGQIFFLSDF